MAMPATGCVRGTPASSMARQPPQTDAMLLLPFDSVMVDLRQARPGQQARGAMTAAAAGFSRGLTRP